MSQPKNLFIFFLTIMLVLCVLMLPATVGAQSRDYCGVLFACVEDEPAEEFDEAFVIIEINATDGDVGFHAKYDGGPWTEVSMYDPEGNLILEQVADGGLADQNVTENFFESSEPLCVPDPEEPDERVQALAEFLALFPEGDYMFVGETGEGGLLVGDAEFSYDIPAAPDISATEDIEFGADEPVVVSWAPGDDLGEKCHDQSLIDDGTIADPASVEVVRWELVVEPDNDEAADPARVIAVYTPPDQMSVTIPDEFLTQFLTDGFNEFKFEVGAREETGNQTFSEGTFTIECLDCEGGEEEDDEG